MDPTYIPDTRCVSFSNSLFPLHKKWSFPLRIFPVNATKWWNMTTQTLHEKNNFCITTICGKEGKYIFIACRIFPFDRYILRAFFWRKMWEQHFFAKTSCGNMTILFMIFAQKYEFFCKISEITENTRLLANKSTFCWRYMWNLPILLRREILSAITMIIYVKIKNHESRILSLIFNHRGIWIENLFFILLHTLMLLVDFI